MLLDEASKLLLQLNCRVGHLNPYSLVEDLLLRFWWELIPW
jgi:hypothetical protein